VAGVIRLIVVDDHPAIAVGVGTLIGSFSDIAVVGTASNFTDGVALVQTVRADVALVDVMLGDRSDGLRLIERIRRAPDAPGVVMYSAFDSPAVVRAALLAGAASFVRKGADPKVLADAVCAAARGKRLIQPDLVRIAHGARPRPSSREDAILRLVAEGWSNEEIGTRLRLNGRTIESHLRRMFLRYGVLSRTELTALAGREGWLIVTA